MCTRTEENVAVVENLGPSQEDQWKLQVYRFHFIPQTVVVRIIFLPRSWVEEEMTDEDLTEVIHQLLNKKSIWMMWSSFG